MPDQRGSRPRGVVYTFYSFKGGVGRSMALANIATLLAVWGKRVLVIDWDLEAPGIEKYFAAHIPIDRGRRHIPGLVELVAEVGQGRTPRWRDYLIHAEISSSATVDIITAGLDDGDYVSRLRAIDWSSLFAEHGFGNLLEDMRSEWIAEYEFVLVDSRTGITDIGGICTIHLPDVIVTLFTANQQSLEGIRDVMRRARRGQKALQLERNRLLVLPVPARDESDREYKLAEEWRSRSAVELKEFFADWAPRTQKVEDILNLLKVPYFSYWSFGERLPVLEEDPNNPKTLAGAFALLARLVLNRIDCDRAPLGATSVEHDAQLAASDPASAHGFELRPPRFADNAASVTILHLSDLQFSEHHWFAEPHGDFSILLLQLCKDLDLLREQNGLWPDLVAITGDLTDGGTPRQFKQVARFATNLLAHLRLDPDRLLLIPGNHDVNREQCEVYFRASDHLKSEPERPYWPKWQPFVGLLNQVYRYVDRYRFTEREPWTLFEIPSLKVVVAGINSTIYESHRVEDHIGFVGEEQLRWFAARLAEYERKQWLRVGLVHHNVARGAMPDGETLADVNDLLEILGDRLHLLLHGRTHQGGVELLGPRLPVLSTGSSAARRDLRSGSSLGEPGEVPNQYQIVRLSAGGLWCAAREYTHDRKRWIGDTRVSKHGDRWWYSLDRAWTKAEATFGRAEPDLELGSEQPTAGTEISGDPSPPRRNVILLFTTDPSGTTRLALDEECAAIERELAMTPGRDRFELRSKWAASMDEMMRHLNELQPTIIHFSGHGSRGDGFQLANDGQGASVSERVLTRMIASAAPSTRMVVLDACFNDRVADSLCTTVDCVVGTTSAVGDASARSFAVSFYRALGNQRSVGNAVAQANATLAARRSGDQSAMCLARDGMDVDELVFSPTSDEPGGRPGSRKRR